MWVCLCFKLNEKALEGLVEEHGLEAVVDKCKKKGCGSCVKTIDDLQRSKSA